MSRSPITQAVLDWLATECAVKPVTPATSKSQMMYDAGKQHILARARQAAANDAEEAATRTFQT